MKKIIKRYWDLNIYFKLLPFLAIYLIICIAFNKNELEGDESRYVTFASNIINGFFSNQYSEVNLACGPGYPLLLTPFVLLKLPLIILKLLNALLLYLSLIISFKTFSFYSSTKNSFLFTSVLGLYYPIFEQLPQIYSECFTWFLINSSLLFII